MSYSRDFPAMALAVQQLGQWENSGDITLDILLQAINYGFLKAHDIMVAKWADYYTIDTTFSLIAGQDTYPISPIATDFYKLRHLDWSQDGVRFHRMLPYDLAAQWRYTSGVANSGRPPRYRMQARNLIFSSPVSAAMVKMWYIPVAFQYVNTSDDTGFIFDAPVEEMLIVNIANRFILVRSDLDTRSADAAIAEYTAGLRSAADNRDAGEPFSLDPNGPPRGHMWYGSEGEDW